MRSKITLLLLAVVALLPTMASTAASSYAETRVWGFESETPAGARAERGLSAISIEGYRLAYDELVVGYPLVPRGTARLPSKPGQVKHIFRDAPGHLADTPANRRLLQRVADDASTTLGMDKFGNVWSARALDDGTQVWVQSRNGVIQNGGLNQTPRIFDPTTGLSGQ